MLAHADKPLARACSTARTLSTANYDALLHGWAAQTAAIRCEFQRRQQPVLRRETARAMLISAHRFLDASPMAATTARRQRLRHHRQDRQPGTSSSTQFTIPTYRRRVQLQRGLRQRRRERSHRADRELYLQLRRRRNLHRAHQGQHRAGTGFPRIYFNNGGDRQKLLTIEQWGTGKWTSMNSAFMAAPTWRGKPATARTSPA